MDDKKFKISMNCYRTGNTMIPERFEKEFISFDEALKLMIKYQKRAYERQIESLELFIQIYNDYFSEWYEWVDVLSSIYHPCRLNLLEEEA